MLFVFLLPLMLVKEIIIDVSAVVNTRRIGFSARGGLADLTKIACQCHVGGPTAFNLRPLRAHH